MESRIHELLLKGQRDRAFEEILDAYETKVYRLVLSFIGNLARAEEVAQETFLKVWQALDSFDPNRSSIGTWIYTIARNTSFTHLRGELYRKTVPLDSVAEPAAEASDRDGAGDIRRMVAGLPEELREVVVLFYYQERSVEEVALMLDLPTGTVKSHLFRARKRLGEMMGVPRPA
jgi:RNA polymerase sigma-70 factor (ECF subfamily)